VSNPPNDATNLDSTTPNTILLTVNILDLMNQNILNGPVKYTPISTITDSCSTVSPDNLIKNADGGTFGTYSAGTPSNTGANPNPYTNIRFTV
jgi:hypothetical protein